MMPIVLKADAMAMQALTGGYNSVLMVGASQTSIWGDRSYGVTGMIFDNLKQYGISANTSTVSITSDYEVAWVDGFNVSYMRNYNMNAGTISASRMKPLGKGGKYGTIGLGLNFSTMWGKDAFGESMGTSTSYGYNALYTNSIQVHPRLNYAPAMIFSQSPLTYFNGEPISQTSKDQIYILSNAFTVNITQRFSLNLNWTLIYSTNEFVPLMNSFMIGSKIPL